MRGRERRNHYLVYYVLAKQFQIQSPAKKIKGKLEKKGLDFLVRIEPFQWVIVTPEGKNTFLAPFPLPLAPRKAALLFRASGQDST